MQLTIEAIPVRQLLEDRSVQLLREEYQMESKCNSVPDHNPNLATYESIEKMGMLDILVAKRNGNIVGFASVVTHELPKYSSIATTVEAIFVSKSERKYGAGLKLMKEIESIAIDRGSDSLFLSAPPDRS